MASIDKLAIRGIRAFDPGHEETIQIYTPLTMIVGANGCGKTTIIECLKYITTGSLPPGTGRGHSFVNDPQMTEASEVKASIKLRIIPSGNQQATVVQRCFQITKKHKKMEFKALDGVIKHKNPDGTQTSLSSKCSELDSSVPQLMGVSKAILENVIFCHQEESCWPLSEGAVLKKKFDDIFDSARYSKALESVRKTKVEYASKAKDIKASLAETTEKKKVADQMSVDKESHLNQLESLDKDAAETSAQLERSKQSIEETRAEMRGIEAQRQEQEKNFTQLSLLEARIEEKQSFIQDLLLNQNDRELQESLDQFAGKIKTQQEKVIEKQRELDRTNSDLSSLSEQSNNMEIKIGEAVIVHKNLAESAKEFNALTSTLVNKHNLNLNVVAGNESDVDIGPALESAFRDFDEKGKRVNAEEMAKLKTKQQDYLDASNHEGKQRLELDNLNKQVSNIDNKLASLRPYTGNSHVSQTQQNSVYLEVQSNFENAQTELKRFEDSAPGEERNLKDHLMTIEHDIKTTQDATLANKDAIDLKRKSRAQEAQKAEFERQKGFQQTEINKKIDVICENGDNTWSLFSKLHDPIEQEVPPITAHNVHELGKENICEYYWSRLELYIKTLQKNIENQNKEVQVGQKQEAKLDAHIEDQLAKIEEIKRRTDNPRIQGYINQLSEHLENLNPIISGIQASHILKFHDTDPRVVSIMDDWKSGNVSQNGAESALITLADVHADIKQHPTIRSIKSPKDDHVNIIQICNDVHDTAVRLHHQRQLHDITCKIFTRYHNNFPESNNDKADGCFMCATDEGETMLNAVKRKIGNLFGVDADKMDPWPNCNIESLENIIQDTQILLGKLYEENELQNANQLAIDASTRLRDLKANLESEKKKMTGIITSLERNKKDIVLADTLFRIVKEISSHLDEIGKVKIAESSAATILNGDDAYDRRKIEDIEAEQDELNTKLNELRQSKDNFTQKLMKLNTTKTNLQNRVHEARVAFTHQQNEKDKQEEKKKEATALQTQKEELEGSRLTYAENLGKASAKLKQEGRELNTLREEVKKYESEYHDEVAKFRADVKSYTDMKKNMDTLRNGAASHNVDALQQQHEKLKEDISKKQSKVSELSPEISAATTELSTQKDKQKNLNDVITLRAMKREKSDTEAKLNIDGQAFHEKQKRYAELQRGLQRYQQIQQKHIQVQATLQGRRQEVQRGIDNLESRLQSRAYKDIHDEHRKCLIDHETMLIAVSDLDTYYHALDNALLAFHTSRITEVNKVIKELWETIYRGEDIETIEIVSGEEGSTTAARAARSYNYRVVMKKGDVPLDMRGRCSAGQRMLASIVIRLALAESFCIKSGVLTLDEPTTNLDEENKTSLAVALSRIIASRSKQSNFQLICITHDEEFVRTMKNALNEHEGDIPKPEYYFVISRDQARNSPSYFSHIERLPWAEL